MTASSIVWTSTATTVFVFTATTLFHAFTILHTTAIFTARAWFWTWSRARTATFATLIIWMVIYTTTMITWAVCVRTCSPTTMVATTTTASASSIVHNNSFSHTITSTITSSCIHHESSSFFIEIFVHLNSLYAMPRECS